jgi:glycosyltransferase involved in cell wall biosynthesis
MCVEEIARFNPDVVFCNRSFPEGVLAARCHVRPLLLRTAGQDISKLTKYPIYRQLIRKAVRSASVVLVQSLWEKEWLRKLCGDGLRVEVNLIGIDHKKFRPSFSRAKLRTIYGLPQDAFVVVTNRYLTRPYNGWLVVKALESIVEKWPTLILFYTTPWKMDVAAKSRAKAITARCPRIRFLEGPVAHAEMPKILGCGDVYVSFSSYDGIPNSVLEAMACGLVPIVADLPQLREWIEDGVDGYVLPQNNTQALASIVSHLYQHREQLPNMAAQCVEKIQKRGSYEACSEQTRRLVESIARKCRKETSVAM